MISPRAVALNGVGFRPRIVALQGFAPFDSAQKPDVIPYAPGGMVFPQKKRRRQDRDDDVLMFLLR